MGDEGVGRQRVMAGYFCMMERAPRGDVGEGIGRDRGLVVIDVGPQRRGGWLGFDPWRELRQGLDRIWPEVKIELWGRLLGLFGLWALLKRRKGSGKESMMMLPKVRK
jgi:hypothetical protein